MEDKKFRHKKSGMTVAWANGSKRYISADAQFYLPAFVVEESSEWQDITPIVDFMGREILPDQLHYKVVIEATGVTTVLNVLGDNSSDKILALFLNYSEACNFQRVFVFMKKEKNSLITGLGNPSTYLKNVLKLV